MATEKFDCGCSITFDDAGKVRAVECCDECGCFSEDKSLKQLALDIHHCQLKHKHAPKKKAEPEIAEAAK